jgi:sigma-B regulation protein RsbU (phosphoserine phosphatase)
LLLYSDGLTEFPNDYGDRIGEEGLLKAVAALHPGLTPHEFIERICEAAGIGAESALPDDTTIVCVDRRGTVASRACQDCLYVQTPALSQAAAVGVREKADHQC